jgi:hypothetical protein
MVTLVNRAKMTIVSTGTGTLTLGSAVDGFQNFGAAGVADGDMVRYVIEDGNAWEIGTGIYAAAGPSLTRSPSESSAGGARIPLSGAAVVFITATTADIVQPGDNITKLTNDAGYTANPGTVTSVAAAAGAGISVSGAPVTSSGTLTITNTAPHQPTNLDLTGTGNSRTLTSSTGSNVTLPVVTTTNAGLMATGDKLKLDGIAAGAQVNVGTDLGITGAGDTRTITSSTGSNTIIPTATTSTAGLMATGDKSKLDGIAAGAQVNTVMSVASKTGAVTLAVEDVSNAVATSDTRLTNAREWTASTISQTEAEAGTATTRRAMTAQRIRQAILGWWNGASDKAKLDGIETGAQVNAATNLGITGTGNTRTITSSTGSNVTIPVASTTTAGWLSTADKTKLDGIAPGAQVNVGTNLGITGTGDTRTITSSTGSNATLPTATTSTAGLMATGDKSKLDSIAAGAQVNIVTSVAGKIGAVTLAVGDISNAVATNDLRLANAREWTATTISQTEAEAGTSSTRRAFTAQRMRQAILGWWNGSADKTKLDGIAAGAQVNVGTNLAMGGSGNSRTITSSTGNNVSVPVASTSDAGFMATGDKSKLDGIAAGAQVNVGTNLAMGGSGNSRTITSSTGNNVSVPVASTSNAGFMATGDKTKLDGIAAGAQVNVGTNLGSSGTGATRTITSSTGSNTSITFSAADVGAFPANNIPSGTKMLFVQTSAPTGWTKDTTHNNKALRVVTGTAGSGGNIHFTSAFANRTVSDTAAGGSVHHHTLSWHEMPAHHHLVDHAQALATFGTEGSRWYHRVHGTYVAASHQPDRRTSGAGSSWGHAHGFNGHHHNHSLDMAVQYVDVIIATKD